jgi:tetratricopeptide (TPR) repeat protein
MKRVLFFFVCLSFLLMPRFSAGALDFSAGGYGSIADYLNSVYGPDENAGLTSFPVLNVPMGGRSEGMAGAFSAVADDISFIEYNPAGSSMLSYTGIALFHNNWIADTKLEGAAFSSRIGNFGFGAGAKWLYTPFTEYNIYGDRVSKGYYSEAMAALNASYNFLSGYYFPGVSLGANLKGAFRFVPDYTDADDLGNNTGSLLAGSGRSQSAAMAMIDIGALTRFDFLKPYSAREPNASVALVLRNLGPPAMKDPLPTVAVAAFSYKPLRPLLVSFDFFVPVNLYDTALSEKPYWAAGFSASVTKFLSMRAGLMGKAGNVRITIGSAVNLEQISLDINYTLDLLTQMQPLNRVSLGVRLNLGDGGRGALAARVDELYLAGLDAYAQGDHDQARRHWEDALALNPGFDPAREGLAILAHSQSVRDRIDEMQRLD